MFKSNNKKINYLLGITTILSMFLFCAGPIVTYAQEGTPGGRTVTGTSVNNDGQTITNYSDGSFEITLDDEPETPPAEPQEELETDVWKLFASEVLDRVKNNPIATAFMYVLENLIKMLGQGMLTLSSMLLFVAGTFLNLTVWIGIEQLGFFVKETPAIRDGWVILRDMVNIFFIFGLLFISIDTILAGWSDNSRKHLAKIIMAALLVNFSFFFTTVLIDASNILTLSFYNKMTECRTETDNLGNTLSSVETRKFWDGGLSNCFTESLGLVTFFSPQDGPNGAKSLVNKLGEKNAVELLISFGMGSLFIMVAAVVFFAAGLMILIRMIVLIFLLITSPALFAGWIIPKYENMTKKWISKLSETLISLPVMFLFLYVTYQITISSTGALSAATGLGKASKSSFSLLISGSQDAILLFFNYVLILGFLIGSMIIAKHAGIVGADLATNTTLKGMAKGGRGTFGALGSGLSRLGSKYSDNKYIGSLGRGIARGTGRFGDSMAKSSYNFGNTRAATALSAATGLAGSEVKFDKATKEQEGGFKSTVLGAAETRTLARQKSNEELFPDWQKKRIDEAKNKGRASATTSSGYTSSQSQIDNLDATIEAANAERDSLREQLKAEKAKGASSDAAKVDALTSQIKEAGRRVDEAQKNKKPLEAAQGKIISKETEKEISKVLEKSFTLSSPSAAKKATKDALMEKDEKERNELIQVLKTAKEK